MEDEQAREDYVSYTINHKNHITKSPMRLIVREGFTLMSACIGITGCMAASSALALSKSTEQGVAHPAKPGAVYERGAKKLA